MRDFPDDDRAEPDGIYTARHHLGGVVHFKSGAPSPVGCRGSADAGGGAPVAWLSVTSDIAPLRAADPPDIRRV